MKTSLVDDAWYMNVWYMKKWISFEIFLSWFYSRRSDYAELYPSWSGQAACSIRPFLRPFLRLAFRSSFRSSVTPLIRLSVRPSIDPSADPMNQVEFASEASFSVAQFSFLLQKEKKQKKKTFKQSLRNLFEKPFTSVHSGFRECWGRLVVVWLCARQFNPRFV